MSAAKNSFNTWKNSSQEERLSLLEKLLKIYISRSDEMTKAISIELDKVLSNNSKKEIPVYATIWSDKYKNNEELSSRAIELLNQGYGGIKIYPLQNRTIEEAKICVSKIRDEIGPKTPLINNLLT